MVKEMAERKSFLIYGDIEGVFEELLDEQIGQLMRGILKYFNTGEDPDFGDQILRIVWIPIKQQMDRDIEKYQKRCEKNRESGRLGGRPKKTERFSEKPNETERFLEKPKKADTDKDTDKDKDKDTDTDTDKEAAKTADVCASSIVSHLNKRAGSRYRVTDTVLEQIEDLLEAGYTEADMKAVVDKKCADWLPNDEMRRQLRPSVLFGPHFEEYLNAPESAQAAADRDEAERKARALKAKEEQAAREAALEAEYEAGQKRLSPEEVQARLAAITKKTFN